MKKVNVSPWFAVNRFAAKLFGTATMNRHDPFARETSRLTGTQARVGVPQFGTSAQCGISSLAARLSCDVRCPALNLGLGGNIPRAPPGQETRAIVSSNANLPRKPVFFARFMRVCETGEEYAPPTCLARRAPRASPGQARAPSRAPIFCQGGLPNLLIGAASAVVICECLRRPTTCRKRSKPPPGGPGTTSP